MKGRLRTIVSTLIVLSIPLYLWAQTSRTGRITVGTLSQRPVACTAADVYVATNTGLLYICFPNGVWSAIATTTTLNNVAFLNANNPFTGQISFSGTPPANFYVATAGNGGSDSNDCLAASVVGGHGPCLTVQHACLVALTYDAGGTNLVVNIGTGTFTGVELAGFMRGSPVAGFGAFLVLNGNGAANTTITGFNSVFDISIDSGLLMQVQNMTVSVAANQVGLFYEGPGTNLTVGSGVTINGAASTSIAIQGEQLAYAAFGADVTFSGTFGTLINMGGNVYFDNGHKITCSGLTMTQFISMVGNSYAQFDASASFSGCGAVTGIPYNLFDSSTVNNGSGAALPGTSRGQIQTGARYRPSPAPTVTGTSGLGTGGSASIVANSSSYGGILTITTGSGTPTAPSATGTVSVAFNESAGTQFGSYLPCTATLSNTGGASWASQAVVAINSASIGNLTIAFSNNGSGLTTNTTYQIAWTCGGN